MSITHWLVLIGTAMLLFGSGRVANTMGDFGRGLRMFRREMAQGEAAATPRLEASDER